jgi:signal transduction histidine kinase
MPKKPTSGHAEGQLSPALSHAEWRVVDALADPVLLLNRDWRVMRANQATLRRLGLDAVEGRSVLEALPMLAHTPFEVRVRAAMEAGETVRFTLRYTNDRVNGHFEVTAVPADGGVLLQFRERSVRMGTLDESEAERVTEALVEAGLALSSALSLDRVLQVLADVARGLVGARYAALGIINATGTGLSDFITSGLTPQQRERMGSLPTGHGILGLLIREPKPIRLRDLKEHPASAGIPGHHPSMRSFLGVPVSTRGRVFGNLYVTDKLGADEFSDRDLAILELLGAQAAVAIENAQLRQERDRFFAAASHELGNAVAGITVWARHLLRQTDASGGIVKDGLGKIIQGAESAHKLIEDLLSLSKIREGRLTLTSWPVDLGEVAADAVSQLRPTAESAGLHLDYAPPTTRNVVDADPMRVRQILVNLLANATKFTPAGGHVSVGVARAENGDVLAWVRDEGPGIAAEDTERIFRPYEQVSGTARGRGTGLGLPLSRQLARLMGGEVSVQSEVGAGSTFTLRLPARAPTPAHA